MKKLEDYSNISKVLDRVGTLQLFHSDYRVGLMMDLDNCDDDTPLDFEKLLGFDDRNFAHDIYGIYRNFNRVSKKLDNCFVPRCAKQVTR